MVLKAIKTQCYFIGEHLNPALYYHWAKILWISTFYVYLATALPLATVN